MFCYLTAGNKKALSIWITLLYMVPMDGFEPSRLAPLPPQDSVSTNSTTSARYALNLLVLGVVSGILEGHSGLGRFGRGRGLRRRRFLLQHDGVLSGDLVPGQDIISEGSD
jgi:hypothetical protein